MILTPLPTSRLVGFIELLANFQGEWGDATLIGTLRLLGEQRLTSNLLDSDFEALGDEFVRETDRNGLGPRRQLHCDSDRLSSELEQEYRKLSQLARSLALR